MRPLGTAAATSFLSTLLLFLHLTASFPSSDMSNLSNCNQTFSCGALTDITYPFTGGQRPPLCGPPEFRLTCNIVDSVTTLMFKSLPYRVTRVNQTSQTLRLSRSDFYDDLPCTHLSSSTTFDNDIFSLGSNNENLTLFYGCKNLGDAVEEKSKFSFVEENTKFSCPMPGYLEEGFFKVGDHPSVDRCRTSFQVPFLQSWKEQLEAEGSSLLGKVLKEGFDVRYSDPYSADCQKCSKHSGRQCGFDAKPICICNDHLCPGTGSSRFGKGLMIATAISAAMAAIIAFSIIAICFSGREGSFSGNIAMTFKLKNSQNVDRFETFMMDYHCLTPRRYSYSDIKKITNSFTNKLGEGGFGNVYKGKLTDGRLVAVKVLKESKGDGEEFMNEVASISRTSHVNIVTLLGFCYEKTKRALIYEFMAKGSLDKFISYEGAPDTNFGLQWERFYEIAVGIARGLEYLHRGCNTRIVHFDIKPHNILLDEDFCPKISDFGLAKLCKSKESKVSMIGARGTVGYIAPEVFCRNFGGVSYKSDVYSYGMMVLEMVGERKKNYTGSSETSETYFPDWFYKYLEPGEITLLHEGISEEEEEIIKKIIVVGLWCIQTIPSDRPSMTKVVEMFEGSLHSLQIPLKPLLSSPQRSAQDHSSTISSLPSVSSHGGGVNKLSVDESDLELEISILCEA
ncbi:hypothetical protein POTOM_017279 [Populus tomentosa]|uniref:non-specific serine/threonine protein kinase n=1 Tax=Populus tomentosa TaxID=118781 RepID=A0A8X8CVK4_POPTO|nr:hypothetical protein POTOM_017279 [Populus tomentosa]